MIDREPAFAADDATASYYERRAPEYDEWYRGEGVFAVRDRPGWDAEVERLCAALGRLAPGRTLDVACGTAFLAEHLAGELIGIDQSPSMVAIARRRIRRVIVGDALNLPLPSGAVERIFAGHFYGHLSRAEQARFLVEANRVGRELVVVDSAHRPGVPAELWQERVLNDGSRHVVYKRYLTASQLSGELDGEVLFEGDWFVAARAGTLQRA